MTEQGKGRHSYTSTHNLSHTGITIPTKNPCDMNNSIHICRHTGTKHNPSVSQTSSRHKQITLVSGTVAVGNKLRKTHRNTHSSVDLTLKAGGDVWKTGHVVDCVPTELAIPAVKVNYNIHCNWLLKYSIY